MRIITHDELNMCNSVATTKPFSKEGGSTTCKQLDVQQATVAWVFFYVFAQCLQDRADDNKIDHYKTFVTLSIKGIEL